MKKASLFGAAALALSFAAAPAQASVYFEGSTLGCFGAGCSIFTLTPTDSHLTYTGTSFSGTSDVSGDLTVNLGTFNLANGTHTYSNPFTLEVQFSLPTGVTPNGSMSTFLATVTGSVHGNSGSVSIDFDNTLHHYAWAGGTFDFSVSDVSQFSTGEFKTVAGEIHITSVAAVPEPGTWAMMIMGFAGVGFMAYRRRMNGGASFRLA